MRIKYVLPMILLCALGTSHADNVSNSQETSTVTQNTTVNNSAIGTAEDWGLTQEEWSRYQKLMKGPNGQWYPHLSPTIVLGMNAETSQEQQYFADIVAKQEHDKLAKELAFNNAVHHSLVKLYASEPVIQSFDMSAYNPIQKTAKSNTVILQAGDHILLFTDIKRGPDFVALPQLIADVKTHKGVVLDIYCVGNPDESAITQWAKLNNIPADLVQASQITLNQENGQLQKLVPHSVSLPYVVLLRNGISQPISLWSLS